MNKTMRIRIVVLVAALFVLVAGSGCGASSSPAPSSSVDGQTLVTEQCGRCHPLERVVGATKDQAGWTSTVARMRTNGLSVTDEQATAIVDYLTKRDAAK